MTNSGKAESQSPPGAEQPAARRGPDFAAIQKKVTQRFEEEEAAKVYQLAFWQEDRRAMPVHFLACALFAGIHTKDAQYLDNVEIANANGFKIRFKGRRLTQVHADVWQGIMHIARSSPEGTRVRFKSRAFLQLIGRHDGKSQREQLYQWITDLVATSVEIVDSEQKRLYFGSLLPQGGRDDSGEDSVYAVEINRHLCKLFDSGFALVDWDERQKLRGKWLALWLQHYFSRFKRPVQVSELHRLSGSNAQLKEFRRALKQALEELEASGGYGAAIDGSDVVVEKASQKPALAQGPVGQKPPEGGSQGSFALPSFAPEGSPRVTPRAKAQFAKLYPELDAVQCFADFSAWLASTGRTADKPDAAFLGFAKKWSAKR